MKSFVKLLIKIVIGNALLVSLMAVVAYLTASDLHWVNVLFTSFVFLFTTLLILSIVRIGLRRSVRFPVIGVVFIMTLIRIVFSVLWLFYVKSSGGINLKQVLLEFIVIYLFYLILDAVVLDRKVRESGLNLALSDDSDSLKRANKSD